jgi:MFS family permease
MMPYLSTIGVARSISSAVATFMPLMSIAGRLGFGWLSDRMARKYVAGITFAMVCLGLLSFGYTMFGAWLLIPFLLLFGIGYGGSNVMRMALTREYFGSTRFGTVFGLMIGISMLGNMIGPPLAGWVYDYFGNYQGIWLALATAALLSVVAVVTVSPMKISSSQQSP